MEKDFIKELGYLAFASRLKRLSDQLMQSGRRMYQKLDIPIEPNWFLVFKILEKYHEMSVMEIAKALQLAHPSVITITNKMQKAGYLISVKSKNDSRKRVLSLSEKAVNQLPEYERVWQAGTKAIHDAFEDLNILTVIEQLEIRFAKQDFQSRTVQLLNNNIE